MVFLSKKIIKGKERCYLEKSIRLPEGGIKKFSVYLKEHSPGRPLLKLKEYKRLLDEKGRNYLIKTSIRAFKTNLIFNESTLRRLEEIKLEYKEIWKKLTKNQRKDVLDRFTVNFTYESNAIEGNSLTLKDVTFIMNEGKILKGKELREVYETINTRKAIEWIFQKKPIISEKNLIKLHKILVENTGVTLGYKKIPNFLVGRNVETTPPESVKKEMDNLIQWYDSTKNMHPVQKAAIFHGKLEKIHPFEDGNGRVGRLLINIMLLKSGYSPLIIRKTQRVRYFHALEAFDHGHHDNVYRFLLEKYKDTYEKFFKVYLQYLR